MIELAPTDRRWQALVSRDALFDDRFVYAVVTTGVYCLPSCPSRNPRRENVRLFAIPELAERAGFRACRRCHPDRREADDPTVALARRLCRFIDAQPEPPTLETLAAEAGLSASHLQRLFTRVVGVSPRAYADARRQERFRRTLSEGVTVTEALYDAGYGSSSRLYTSASAHLGMTPGDYRDKGADQRVIYTVVACPLGRLLIAATARGLCAVRLGDDDAALEAELRRELERAELVRDDAALAEPVAAVLEHLDGRRPHLELPLDVQATAFQRQVWEALQRIPYGETRSYGELAEALGRPSASRAVARACASNPVALVVPCHRVVRADGGLSGYRWGVERKRTLLAREADARPLSGASPLAAPAGDG